MRCRRTLEPLVSGPPQDESQTVGIKAGGRRGQRRHRPLPAVAHSAASRPCSNRRALRLFDWRRTLRPVSQVPGERTLAGRTVLWPLGMLGLMPNRCYRCR